MLKTRYALLTIGILMLVSLVGCSKKSNIHYDGYYSNYEQFNEIALYLKFYPDGTVTASLPLTVNQQIQFSPSQLDKGNAKDCTIRGKYILKGNTVVFKIADTNGSADFSGEFRENNVTLKSHSNVNGKDSVGTYNFYKTNP